MEKQLDTNSIQELQKLCKQERIDILSMINKAQSGHPGGSLSAVEILTVLYSKCMTHFNDWKKNPKFSIRDRFILSKGHASACLYSVLARQGYFPVEELLTFRQLGSRLQGHPCSQYLDGIEVSTGSLGQGLSIACGMALGLKLDKIESKIYVYLGDGELQEGSVWESAMQASSSKLDNIIAIVDRNNLQIDGNTEEIKALGNIALKFQAFGWKTFEIDGHNIPEIYKTIELAKEIKNQPIVIIANTHKGQGVSFMQDNPSWHGKALNDEELKLAIEELR